MTPRTIHFTFFLLLLTDILTPFISYFAGEEVGDLW